MPKYQELTYNEIMGCPLEYGSEEREKLRLGYAHQVQIEAGRLGVLEVQYFHPLSISNLTLTCACCGITLASYSGVYKHSQKCPGIHPNEKAGRSLESAPIPITATHITKEDDEQPNKVSPTGKKPNWLEDGFVDMGNIETTQVQKREEADNDLEKVTAIEVCMPNSGASSSNNHGMVALNNNSKIGVEYQKQDTRGLLIKGNIQFRAR